ncbi:hypothetical protein Bca52824_039896 [Brassica carinata]|uniref:Uncharacterized protein n=1 Tax=Brassica carinata TaxID=52824 RepID=A0A8X7RSH1_BRACI|nr:hypothetical protein Bca52824_039896 [Brassica carinata]
MTHAHKCGASEGGANNLGDDMPGDGAVKAQPSSNVTNVVPLNHTVGSKH